MILSTLTHARVASAKSFNIPATTISSLDILGNPQPTRIVPGYEGLNEKFSDLKKLPPLRGAGGNHDFEDFNIPFMAHYTQSRSENREFAANLEAQGEVA